VLLYRSQNLTDWEYIDILIKGDRHLFEPFWTGTIWECPNLVQVGDKHVLIVSFQHHETGQLLYSGYFLGQYRDLQFTPETPHILDYGAHFYAPQVMQDDQGRTILWGWLWEGRSEAEQRKAGWAGIMSLPRLLTMHDDGMLGIEPVPELQSLRDKQHHLENLTIVNEQHHLLDGIEGTCLEILATIVPDKVEQFGLKVRCTPDGQEETWVLFDRPHQMVTIEREKSSLSNTVSHDVLPARQVSRNAPLEIAPGEPIQLHVFLDNSVVEVFVNGRITLSSRIYPTRSDSVGLALFARNGRIHLPALNIWQLNAANVAPPPA
jgi:beta-fructofuranosidase